ncbi:type II toxin-antitoxin system HicB family antitoxin [Biformimicrobium ophioploci]|uniref:HicB-like antitoxin of toxin-antitoxin system domain-containing protein n=1 Tax=Biformimicrobium ophioploci TaxID=3036711 RepID=A0ABQ6M0A2_9GAMM|nr:type II toxin-antitoxin system HicB family antitoxin [Microbulbifer sp. NKW57]GMG87756.1 hypothetical protein MNKW57_20770 [Microbulbifer sp. NKW57]
MRYPVVVHNFQYSGFGAIAPDLPHCHVHGETLDETLQKMAETIVDRLDELQALGEPIPAPATIDHYRNNPAFKDGIWAIVDIVHTQPST